MGIFTRKSRPRAFTAAATTIKLNDGAAAKREAAQQKKRPYEWQVEAWRMYDDMPEVRAGARWMGDAVSRVRMFPAYLPDDPEADPISIDDAPVSDESKRVCKEAMASLTDSQGGHAEIKRAGGENLFVAGDGWLVGAREDPEDLESPLNWQVCSVEELAVSDREVTTVDDDGNPVKVPQFGIVPYPGARQDDWQLLDPNSSELIRVYRRHPRFKDWPDAAMHPAILICKEILLITESIMGATQSRVPAGLLILSDQLSYMTSDDREDEEEGEAPKFSKTLMDHMVNSIKEQRSAARSVPIIATVPDELVEHAARYVELSKSMDELALARLDHLLGRLAIALDLPPSKLLGNADSNYANAWLDTADAIDVHVMPYAQLWADAVAIGYLREVLKGAGVTEDLSRFVIGCDPSALLQKPNPADNATTAYEVAAIKTTTFVKSLGYAEEDIPDDAERAEIIATLQAVKQSKALPPGTPANGQGGPPAPTNTPESGDGTPPGQTDPNASNEQGAITAAGGPSPSGLGRQWARAEQKLLSDLLVAADAQVRHALTRAANRVRGAAQKDKGLAALSAVVDQHELAARLGRDGILALGLDEAKLFAGGWGNLETLFLGWTAKARARAIAQLRAQGAVVDDDALAALDQTAERNRDLAWAGLGAALLALAAPILYGAPQVVPEQGEASTLLTVPPGVIRDALATAGGGPVLTDAKGTAVDAPTGAGGLFSGQDWADVLASMPNVEPAAYVWEVGDPDRPFEPHQALAGETFTSFTDDVLANDGDWPDNDFLYPGDHDGCLCVANADVTITDMPEEG